jgi:RNA polymerase sigma factor (sigma-70 family)
VWLEGRRYTASAVLEGLRASDEPIVGAVARQIVTDRNEGLAHSVVLEMVCDAFRGQIIAFLRRVYFPRDQRALEEVWNDTLERAYYRIEQFDMRRSKFGTWLFNQAKYAAWDRVRALERDRKAKRASEQTPPVPWRDPFIVIVDEEMREAMRRAYVRLSERDQRLLFLKHVLGCRHNEIARHRLVGDLPEAHVRVYTNRAAQRLASLYLDELDRGEPALARERVRALDELWSIQRVIGELEQSGEYEQLACLDADLEASRTGRVLRASFRRRLAGSWFTDADGRELERVEQEQAESSLSDEEVEALLSGWRGKPL